MRSLEFNSRSAVPLGVVVQRVWLNLANIEQQCCCGDARDFVFAFPFYAEYLIKRLTVLL